MANVDKKSKALHIFLGIFVVVSASLTAYFIYDYNEIKKANATVVTPQQAMAMAQQVLNS